MTDDERALLEFEERHPRDGGRKLDAIRAQFDVSAARYYQLLFRVAALPEAAEQYPMLVKRIQRRLAMSTGARASRSLRAP